MNKSAPAFIRAIPAVAILVVCSGCPPQGPGSKRLEPLPLDQAAGLVDANLAEIHGALQAVGGSARGHYTDEEGKKHRIDCDAKVLVLLPRHVRFDLSVLGKSYLLLGSNDRRYWAVSHEPDNVLRYGTHDAGEVTMIDGLGMRPDLLIEALGLTSFSALESQECRPVQRITDEHQQILFIERDPATGMHLSREYWLSRYEPRLIDRIVFRDQMGRVVTESRLSKYARIDRDGPLLAHQIDIDWPTGGGHLTFTTWDWKILPNVTEAHPGFAFPLDRGERFDEVIDLDQH